MYLGRNQKLIFAGSVPFAMLVGDEIQLQRLLTRHVLILAMLTSIAVNSWIGWMALERCLAVKTWEQYQKSPHLTSIIKQLIFIRDGQTAQNK